MVTGDEGTFALKIDNWSAFQTLMFNLGDPNDSEKLNKNLDKKDDELKRLYAGDSNNKKVAFLNYLSLKGLNSLSMYKVDSDFKWSKQVLDPTNSNKVKDEPCN